ncbi:hypothetical protein C3Y87_01940 [Carbonactinospora thermoautotrophica]|uniref:hypothetical protein n=1 Tax=Carbonactinospora thermoautotrophica TaxID=1469144 RepID=UPI00226FD5CB|nr:hypothetical protein [Carbonactinospora thermoautotrophica]MCX9190192.1 hypothetical protein [Carbonactinospora thermoautotrophica]
MEQVVLAHGIGGRQDLPIPFTYALWGGAIAVAVSFLALGLLWRESKLRGAQAGLPLPLAVQRVVDSAAFGWALRLLGLALAGFTAFAALFGPDLANNPTAGIVYVLFWVGIVPASLLFGPVWRYLNPLRTIHRLLALALRTPPERGLRELPKSVGYWPAAAGLFAFTWLELVAPDRATTSTLKIWFGLYAGVHLTAAALYGSRWFDRCDAFEVYSALIGKLSPFGRRVDGRLVLRNPFDGLDSLRVEAGLVATVCVMLGSTAYDGLSNSIAWITFVQDSGRSPVLLGTLGLTGTILLVMVTYTLGTWASGVFGHVPYRELPGLFAHSIVPIAVGYVVAHYFSLFIFEGQHTLILASDPLVNGSDWFGTAERGVNYRLVSPTTIAMVQVLGVVIGHVLGVVAAHDRAVRLFPRTHAIAGQLPLLVIMVGYTLGGLTLLFSS